MQTPNSSNLLRDAGLGGFSSATSQIAAFYLRMANEIFPVVEIDPGRRVAIVALKSVSLGPSSFR
jgi:conjugal transfer pilus assembly protein TraB